MCLTCHDGEHARRERHPIGRSFASDQVTLPAGWPALDGKLGCATCHTLRHACSRPGTRPPATPAFVRDYDGVDLAGFCARCHVDDQTHHRFNPHAVQYVNDRVNESACGFCHLPGITEHERLSRSGRAHLRTGEPTLCLSCHRHHVDYFSPGHVGARVSPKIKAALTTSDEARNLPLAAGETVTCSTCHNPHQRGVFVESSVLARGGTTPERQTGALAMRGFGKTICGACHEP
jgi:hypothetical protein